MLAKYKIKQKTDDDDDDLFDFDFSQNSQDIFLVIFMEVNLFICRENFFLFFRQNVDSTRFFYDQQTFTPIII